MYFMVAVYNTLLIFGIYQSIFNLFSNVRNFVFCIRKMKRWSYTIKALEDNQATDYLPVLLFLFLFLLLFASYSTRVFAFYMAGTFLMFPGYLDLHI